MVTVVHTGISPQRAGHSATAVSACAPHSLCVPIRDDSRTSSFLRDNHWQPAVRAACCNHCPASRAAPARARRQRRRHLRADLHALNTESWTYAPDEWPGRRRAAAPPARLRQQALRCRRWTTAANVHIHVLDTEAWELKPTPTRRCRRWRTAAALTADKISSAAHARGPSTTTSSHRHEHVRVQVHTGDDATAEEAKARGGSR